MPGRASDRLAGLGAPPELVDFLRCLCDDMRLDPTGLGWAFDDLPVTPDSVTFSPDGASSVRSSARTASSPSATTGTADAPTPSLECAAVFVDHRGRVTGFPSSIIAYVLAPDGNVLEVVTSGLPSGQTLTGDPVGGGYVVAEAGIDQYGEYVIERATLVTGSGSEDVTAALIRSLGNDVNRVDAGEGIVLGDPACRP